MDRCHSYHHRDLRPDAAKPLSARRTADAGNWQNGSLPGFAVFCRIPPPASSTSANVRRQKSPHPSLRESGEKRDSRRDQRVPLLNHRHAFLRSPVLATPIGFVRRSRAEQPDPSRIAVARLRSRQSDCQSPKTDGPRPLYRDR